jgi:3,4-dihydroxy 2-butanone 4-phosphate synthase/GTP cyclohydrolase II
MHTAELSNAYAAAADLARGRLAILIDDATGTADLVMAAGRVSAAGIAFMATHGRGLTELALSAERIADLRLAPMGSWWDSPRKPFAISIEARHGVTTGISAHDRAQTIRAAVAPYAQPADLISPGHVFPLRGRAGGLAELCGRTEAALSLARIAGCGEGAVLCELLDDDGEQARGPALAGLTRRLNLPAVAVSAILAYERQYLVGPVASPPELHEETLS